MDTLLTLVIAVGGIATGILSPLIAELDREQGIEPPPKNSCAK